MEMNKELRTILYKVYGEGFDAGSAVSDRHDFDVVDEAVEEIKERVKAMLPKKKIVTKKLLEEDKQACAYFSDGWNNAIIEVEINIEEE